MSEAVSKAGAVVVMGVAGCGKSTVGRDLAERLHCLFLEGDQFHPPANVAKMSRGTPLEDADRWPWLDELGRGLGTAARDAGSAVAACSALKRTYRDRHADTLRTSDGNARPARSAHVGTGGSLHASYAARQPVGDT